MRVAPAPPAAVDRAMLFDPATYLDGTPHEELARRRREEPVGWVEEKPLLRRSGDRSALVAGSGYWAVTRHATIVASCKRRDVFSSGERGAFLPDPKSPRDLEQTRQLLLNMDPPDHPRIRQSVAARFQPRALSGLRGSLLAQARALVDAVRGREEFDAVPELCAELPLLAIADLVGMAREDRGRLLDWSTTLVGFDDPDLGGASIEAYPRTFAEARAYAMELAREKRARPGEDLVSFLVRDVIDQGLIDMREYASLFLLLVIAGSETTRHLLSGMLEALAHRPDQCARLRADPSLIPSAVEESLRFVSPVIQFRRTAMCDTELDGQPIRRGDKVVLYYASANHDEAVFQDPGQFRIDRSPNPHLGFGFGPHFCLGAALARLEAAALLEAMLPYLNRFELTATPTRVRSNFVNGIKSMPCRIAPDRGGGNHG